MICIRRYGNKKRKTISFTESAVFESLSVFEYPSVFKMAQYTKDLTFYEPMSMHVYGDLNIL